MSASAAQGGRKKPQGENIMALPALFHRAAIITQLQGNVLSPGSSSLHWNLGQRGSSISGGHGQFSLNLSILLQNLSDLLWTSFMVFLLVSCHFLAFSSWLRLQVCLNTLLASLILRAFTVSDRGFIPDLHISSFLLTWSLHDIPIFCGYTTDGKCPRCYRFVLSISSFTGAKHCR